MEKSLFEQMGSTYEQQGDYLLPRLTLPAEKEDYIGVWGQRHLRYLKEYRKAAKGRKFLRMDAENEQHTSVCEGDYGERNHLCIDK